MLLLQPHTTHPACCTLLRTPPRNREPHLISSRPAPPSDRVDLQAAVILILYAEAWRALKANLPPANLPAQNTILDRQPTDNTTTLPRLLLLGVLLRVPGKFCSLSFSFLFLFSRLFTNFTLSSDPVSVPAVRSLPPLIPFRAATIPAS